MGHNFKICSFARKWMPCQLLKLKCSDGKVWLFSRWRNYWCFSCDRSPAVVIAYLMKSRGWRLAQSYQWVKDRRSSVDINEGLHPYVQNGLALPTPTQKKKMFRMHAHVKWRMKDYIVSRYFVCTLGDIIGSTLIVHNCRIYSRKPSCW